MTARFSRIKEKRAVIDRAHSQRLSIDKKRGTPGIPSSYCSRVISLLENLMSDIRQVHWGRSVVAGLLSEVAVFAIFIVLRIAATLAGVPDIARPMSTLDYIDAMLSSFAMVFLFTLWLGKRIESRFMLHGALVGVVGIVLFTTMWVATTRS